MNYLLLHAPGNDCYETLEHEVHFTLDVNNTTTETLTHDAAGNLTYDGLFSYGYDAWNRMIQVTKAYRDSGGTLHSGSVTTLSRYDGLNRRIEKKVQNSADLDCTYGYYYDRQSLIETRNGSSQVMQQYVWGLDYIDELIGVSNNQDPTADNTCEYDYWACIDANYNVSRLLGQIGTGEFHQPIYGTVERYEYTPYGQRTVFISAGSNDPDCYAPTLMSQRMDRHTIQPYGLCPIGHQGLYLDEETGIVRNRARDYKPDWGRFVQPDPRRYVDGMNYYQYLRGNPIISRDPLGMVTVKYGGSTVTISGEGWYGSFGVTGGAIGYNGPFVEIPWDLIGINVDLSGKIDLTLEATSIPKSMCAVSMTAWPVVSIPSFRASKNGLLNDGASASTSSRSRES